MLSESEEGALSVDRYRKKRKEEEIGTATSAMSEIHNNKDTKDLDR